MAELNTVVEWLDKCWYGDLECKDRGCLYYMDESALKWCTCSFK